MMNLKEEKKYGFGIDYMTIGLVIVVILVVLVIVGGGVGFYLLTG
jgi:hypothetical protein|tara:strand:- start:397 stop:531 length:135 start_codon:yes stop_codon:yes gene_type:complete